MTGRQGYRNIVNGDQDKVKNAVAGKLDSVDKAVNPFRKVKDQLNSGVKG